MTLHGKSFIGEQLSAGTGEIFRVHSPLDGTPLEPPFLLAGEKDVVAAMELAEEEFALYRETTGEQIGPPCYTLSERVRRWDCAEVRTWLKQVRR